MTPFERVVHGTERWLDAIDRERDTAACAMGATLSAEIGQWLDQLDAERSDVTALLLELRRLQSKNLPALLFAVRPARQLKVGLRPAPQEGVA